jgi:hypothetical protein
MIVSVGPHGRIQMNELLEPAFKVGFDSLPLHNLFLQNNRWMLNRQRKETVVVVLKKTSYPPVG